MRAECKCEKTIEHEIIEGIIIVKPCKQCINRLREVIHNVYEKDIDELKSKIKD